jgi:hypothetical protein
MTDGNRLCRSYYGARSQLDEAECDAIYYGELDFWDHMAAAARDALAGETVAPPGELPTP